MQVPLLKAYKWYILKADREEPESLYWWHDRKDIRGESHYADIEDILE